ncbi:unnamed protein product [Albugo candida]|uniref:Uncharacterized protein n=1 Tax=Albugo candida TaxID=65357 RepID=A0A024FT95_9STRA|nr:unnamed protein product [Albugo candida]|eukprot:CCI10112.1 unnamed protein product [Albugo candida]
MKLRPPILAVVGILQARYQHVGATYVDFALSTHAEKFQTGLNAAVYPPLEYSDDGRLIDQVDPVHPDMVYTVTLSVKDKKQGIWDSERTKSTCSRPFFDTLTKRLKGRTISRERIPNSMQYSSESSSSAQRLHQNFRCGVHNDEPHLSSTDRFRKNNKLEDNDNWKFSDRREHKFGSKTYNTGWDMKWRDLKKLIDMKTLLLLPKITVINPHAYIKNNPGIYSFTWDEETPRLYFGTRNKKEKTAVFMPEDELSISLMYDPSDFWHNSDFTAGRLDNTYCCQARFDFGYEFFQLSAAFPSRYDSWPFLHTNEFFGRSERNKERCGRPFILNLLMNNEPAFTIEPYQHIRDDDVISYLPIQKSERDTFGLGTTFLRKHPVIVDTRDGTMLHQIVAGYK